MLTHNRVTEVVSRCHELLRQTRPPDQVLIVDNGSRDGTADTLRREFPQFQLIGLSENLGPAGGYARGFIEALALKPDYVWAIDDDVRLTPRCLEQLLVEASAHPGAVIFPERLPKDRPQGVGWHGVLIPALAIARFGVPRAEFVWWMEDTEFFLYRLRHRGGVPLRFSQQAEVWNLSLRPRRGYPAWKLYYETRNTVYYRLYVYRNLWRHLRNTLRMIGRLLLVLLREERGFEKARLMLAGLWDGHWGRLGRRVELESGRRSA